MFCSRVLHRFDVMVKVPKGLLCLLSMVLLVRSLVVGRSAGLMKNARAVLRTRAGALNLCMSTSSSSVSEIKLTAQSTTSDKLRVLRQAMNKASIDCFIVPTDDPHMSEYTAFYYNRREWLSGFTGSAGTVIVTNNEALLFTDGRYHNQAELELTKEWTLMRQGNKDVSTSSRFSFPCCAIIHAFNTIDASGQQRCKYIFSHPHIPSPSHM